MIVYRSFSGLLLSDGNCSSFYCTESLESVHSNDSFKRFVHQIVQCSPTPWTDKQPNNRSFSSLISSEVHNVNQLLCPEWVTDWHSATFGTVRERESRPQRRESWMSDSVKVIHVLASLVANNLLRTWIMFALLLESAWTWFTSDGVIKIIDTYQYSYRFYNM